MKNLQQKYLAKTKTHDEIKIVYFGTPKFSAYILERLLLNVMYQVKAVVTGPDKPMGRKQLVNPTPVAMVADKYHIPVLKPEKLDDDFLFSHLSFLTSDLFIVVSYGQILPQMLLDIPKLGAINVHGSLLPKYRGASPIQAAILNGERETGITIIKMDEELDHGPILATKKISISEQDTFEILSNKFAQLGAGLLIKTLPKFVQGKIKTYGQNHAIASFCQKLTKQSGYFDIDNPPSADVLDRMIRAYYPWPAVWTHWGSKIVKFLPGGLLQMEGKKAIPLKDFLNGYPDFPLKNLQ